MPIKIENGIQLAARGKYAEEREIMRKLEVGQSFVTTKFSDTRAALPHLSVLTFRPKRFASRTLKGGGVRIWRIE